MITFEDIFGLYFDHFRGKVLTLVCDCSYSGNWVAQCAKKLDEIGIPSCGHYTREQGILINVYCSCRDDEQASMLAFCEEAAFVNEKKELWYRLGEKLSSGQQTKGASFVVVRCRKKPEEACEIPPHHTWMDRLFNGPFLYLVRGKDKGRPAWHYVLVDKEKEEEFKAQVKTGTVDVANFGKILHSGWGEDPPKEKKKQIDDQYSRHLKPE